MRVLTIEKVKEFVAQARKLVPNVTDEMLDAGGKIYYMNGNDGTDFDWHCNDRLCEFMVFGKNEMGFIKVCVNKNDTIDGYMYADFGMSPSHTIESVKLDEGEAADFACQMYQIADKKAIWDAEIDSLNFDEVVYIQPAII